MRQHYIKYYSPLVKQFCVEMREGGFNDLDLLPQPFLPLFGPGYEQSSLRLAIVGQDTRGWGKDGKGMADFIQKETAEPGSCLTEMFEPMDALRFKQWGQTRHQFFGFAMRLLAAIYNVPNWTMMKRSGFDSILQSFAWGNANSVELWQSTPRHTGVAFKTWEAARKAAKCFDHISHLLTVLKPQIVVVAWKDMKPEEYFAGLDFERRGNEGSLNHYRLLASGVDVFHIPHPNNMRWAGNSGPIFDGLCRRLKETNLIPEVPPFVQNKEQQHEFLDSLRHSPNRPAQEDKYGFVEWVALELAKHQSFMSVPVLAGLINDCGYQTNYGSPFRGGRGTYRLIRGTYDRLIRESKPDEANMVARAFRRPNFEYAYN